jgi:hypothetical protein
VEIQPLNVPLPPSQVETAIREICDEIEEFEIPLLEELERQDRPVWIRFQTNEDHHVTGVAVRDSPPPDNESDGYSRQSLLGLWQQMSLASSCIDGVLQNMAVPEELRVDREWHERWVPLLASGGHGFRLFEMDFARNILPPIAGMYSRAFALASAVLLQDPSPRTGKYLRRIPRAYVFGLDAEVLILCRAAIEAALKDRIEATGRPGVRALLKHAENDGLLAPDDLVAADALINAANAAVHDEPPEDLNVFGAIEDTVAIVTRLLRDASDEEGSADQGSNE